MKLNINSLKDASFWSGVDISVPKYDIEAVARNTKEAPIWVHFGIGNIFRMFIGGLQDTLLNEGLADKGIVCVETFDYDIVDKIYNPFDNLVLGVTLKADGNTERKVIGSLSEAIAADSSKVEVWDRLKEIFINPSLQMVSFTVTEKGYALKGSNQQFLPYVIPDLENGPKSPKGAMAVVTALLYERFLKGAAPIAVVSMDNCSHNGEKLFDSVLTVAKKWQERGFVGTDFIDYLSDEKRVSFPWSMIDKITPRPANAITKELSELGIENMDPIITDKKTYIAPFVNAEGPQYLVIEDNFPAGRPALEKAGVYFTDRETVNEVERMKVTTCLNPLHTALAVYGCLLGYESIASEMNNQLLKDLVYGIGPGEGMEVVCDPKILSPEDFVNEVLTQRLTNAFIPDTPQRIATDTSQKVGIRYGETIKSYVKKYGDARRLKYIPIAIAGWLRYLLAVDDKGNEMERSSDPMLSELTGYVSNIKLGETDADKIHAALQPILSNETIFGLDLYKAGIGEKIEDIFKAEILEVGAVETTLRKTLY